MVICCFWTSPKLGTVDVLLLLAWCIVWHARCGTVCLGRILRGNNFVCLFRGRCAARVLPLSVCPAAGKPRGGGSGGHEPLDHGCVVSPLRLTCVPAHRNSGFWNTVEKLLSLIGCSPMYFVDPRASYLFPRVSMVCKRLFGFMVQ